MKQPNTQAVAMLHRALYEQQPNRRFSAISEAERVAAMYNMTAQQLCQDYWQVKQEQDRKAHRAALAQKIEQGFFFFVLFAAPFAVAAAYHAKG